MQIEKYILSAMCQYEQAAIQGIVEFEADHFTDVNKKMFSLIKGLFQLNRSVDVHVLASQYQGQGGSSDYAVEVFHYCLDHSNDWNPAFQELKKLYTYRKIDNGLEEIRELRFKNEEPEMIASKTTKLVNEWLTDNQKRYMSGKEIDESKDDFGEPIRTGIPLYDEKIYEHGGNLKGQMKGVVCRYKHGKTRSECWEVAQNLRQGHKVLYLTLEGNKKSITGNLKQILRHEWKDHREKIFVKDGVRNLSELESTIIEAVLVDQVDKVVVDYIQLVEPEQRYSGENEKINISVETFRHLMVKHNFHCVVLSQVTKENSFASVPKDGNGNDLMDKGWKHVPRVNDAYGSQALMNASSIILIGFRPAQYEVNVRQTPLGAKTIDPFGMQVSIHAFFMQTAITRYKPDYLHKWYGFVDSNEGLKLNGWV